MQRRWGLLGDSPLKTDIKGQFSAADSSPNDVGLTIDRVSTSIEFYNKSEHDLEYK